METAPSEIDALESPQEEEGTKTTHLIPVFYNQEVKKLLDRLNLELPSAVTRRGDREVDWDVGGELNYSQLVYQGTGRPFSMERRPPRSRLLDETSEG